VCPASLAIVIKQELPHVRAASRSVIVAQQRQPFSL